MKVLDAQQIKAADEFAIKNEPIASIDLMERAALGCSGCFPPIGSWNDLVVICGNGNNGADGLAIARLQLENFENVRVLILETSDKYADNFIINLERWKNLGGEVEIIKNASAIELHPDELVVDAILGSGINRPVNGFLAECIQSINLQKNYVISIDLPSGLDAVSLNTACAIKADLTLTIGAPKPILFFPESSEYVGEWMLVDIYLDDYFFKSVVSAPIVMDFINAASILKERRPFSHKGTYGKALLVVGSEGKYGAAILAARACLRSGVGLLTVHLPSNGTQLIHHSLPEAILSSDISKTEISSINDIDKYDVVGIGPGIGISIETTKALLDLITKITVPIVIDADALNIISENKSWLEKIPANSILTPHPKEYERLFGKSENSLVRIENQKKNSIKYQIYIICKGHYSTITTPSGKVYFNVSGNSGLAKAGSGDVLTGIIASLLAQHYTSEEAALLGVFIHGHAADLLKETMHENGILPSDVIEKLPFAFKDISKANYID